MTRVEPAVSLRHSGGGGVGVDLMGAGGRQRVRAEVRDVPLEEGAGERRPGRLALFEAYEQLLPGGAHAVHARPEASVCTGEVRKLVRDDGVKLFRREQGKVGESEHEVVAHSEQATHCRNLRDSGVEVAVDEQRVHLRAADDAADLFDHREQLRRFRSDERNSFRWIDLHVQRPPEHHDECHDRDQELEHQDPVAAPGKQHGETPECEQDEQGPSDERVPERGERPDPPPVGARMRPSYRLEFLHEL